MATENTAVLLLAHGTPETVDDIPEFLRNITGGRPVPQSVVDEVQHRYGLIGRSPLLDITRQQARALQAKLGLPVYTGMRNWSPFISDVVMQMAEDGVRRAAAICLAPQNSRTSVGLYRKALFAAGSNIEFCFVDAWHNHPLLIQAFAEKLLPAWEKFRRNEDGKAAILFTAHSVPQRTLDEGDPYGVQARETASLVAAKVPGLAANDWEFAFQSQGMSGGPWAGPTVEETILQLKNRGHGGVLMQPVGFVCDHVEVLYDIDILFTNFARENGVRLGRAESLNDSPLLIAALAELAARALGGGIRAVPSGTQRSTQQVAR